MGSKTLDGVDLNLEYSSIKPMSYSDQHKWLDQYPLTRMRSPSIDDITLKSAIWASDRISLALTRLWFEQRGIAYWGGHTRVYCYDSDLFAFELYGAKWNYSIDRSEYICNQVVDIVLET